MLGIVISIGSIYGFIAMGYAAKKLLKEEINEKGLILLSIYFLQPMLSFWGLSTKPIDAELLQAPFIYIAISLGFVFISFFIA